jgi:hypothetical protein
MRRKRNQRKTKLIAEINDKLDQDEEVTEDDTLDFAAQWMELIDAD